MRTKTTTAEKTSSAIAFMLGAAALSLNSIAFAALAVGVGGVAAVLNGKRDKADAAKRGC